MTDMLPLDSNNKPVLVIAQDPVNTAVTVGTSRVKLPTTPLDRRISWMAQNLGPGNIYVGGSAVTAANGTQVPPGASFPLTVFPSIDLYGISDTTGNDVRIMEG